MTSTRLVLGGVTITSEGSRTKCRSCSSVPERVRGSFEVLGGVFGFQDRGGVAGFHGCANLTGMVGLRFREFSGDVGAEDEPRFPFRRAPSSSLKNWIAARNGGRGSG